MANERDVSYLPRLGLYLPALVNPSRRVADKMRQAPPRLAFPVLLVSLAICAIGYAGLALLLANGLLSFLV